MKLIRLDDGDEIAAITKLDIIVDQENSLPGTVEELGQDETGQTLNDSDAATGENPEASEDSSDEAIS